MADSQPMNPDPPDGIDAAVIFDPSLVLLIGCVAPDPSVLTGVIDVIPWMVMTSDDADPAVPSAGCLADVAAPDGSGKDAAETGCVACQNVPTTGIPDWSDEITTGLLLAIVA